MSGARGMATAVLSLAMITTMSGPVSAQLAARDRVLPAPAQLIERDGAFVIDESTRVVLGDPADEELRRLANSLMEPLRAATGFPLRIVEDAGEADASVIELTVVTAEAAAAGGAAGANPKPYDWSDRVDESYHLTVTSDAVRLTAPAYAGLFRGAQTLRQLLPPELGQATIGDASGAAVATAPAASATARPAWTIPAIDIEDAPRFPYRGMHLDVGRHLFPVSFIRNYIDLLAAYRMNVFHWHLTEDQGWRIEIEKYPRLTSVGAWRDETVVERNFDPYVGDGIRYGGYYTQDEIREIVEYAAERYITIVPEIEMPGHSVAALAAYPELACTPGPFEVYTRWGITSDIYCPSERTFSFLEDVLTEVMALFPGRYIHIGGDEAPKTAWEQSPLAQEVIRREGLADEHELQSWFIRRIEAFLADHGRRIIGWDEILEGGLAPEATVMSWRGTSGGIAAAQQGHDVIMTPTSHLYFDYYQGDPAHEPLAIGGDLPLRRVYEFEPVPAELTSEQTGHVLGAQANVWTEYMKTMDHVEYMVMPRMLALSEIVWSRPEHRDWAAFLMRLPWQLERLDARGVNYRVPEVGGLEADRLTLEDTAYVTLASVARGTIRYTTDGSEPTASSTEYTGPLVLAVDAAPVTVAARVFLPDGRTSAPSGARFARTTLRDPVEIDAPARGLRASYFEGRFRSADQTRDAAPLRTTVAERVAIPVDARAERFALRFEGYVRVPADGVYTFVLSSDDGSRLRIGDVLVIDHDGPHGLSEKSGQIALRAGWHPIEVAYFQGGGGRALDLRMAAAGEAPRPVPAEALAHADQ